MTICWKTFPPCQNKKVQTTIPTKFFSIFKPFSLFGLVYVSFLYLHKALRILRLLRTHYIASDLFALACGIKEPKIPSLGTQIPQ